MSLWESILTSTWNGIAGPVRQEQPRGGLDFGTLVREGVHSKTRIGMPHEKRAEHVAILGKTGSGKSMLLRHLAAQDIAGGRGFVFFDLHGDATPDILKMVLRCFMWVDKRDRVCRRGGK